MPFYWQICWQILGEGIVTSKTSNAMSVSIAITLDTRRMKKKTGNYPVKLLVTHKSTPERYQTIFDLSQEEFDNLSASRVSEKLKKIRDDLKLIQRKAEDVAYSLGPFNFEEFEKDFIADKHFLSPA